MATPKKPVKAPPAKKAPPKNEHPKGPWTTPFAKKFSALGQGRKK